MNHIYKTVWNEQTRTFVAVAENKKAKGKHSGASTTSKVSRAICGIGSVLAVAGVLSVGSVFAQSTSPVVEGNEIRFIEADGAIHFTDGTGVITGVSSISGLTSLTVNGAMQANQLTVTNNAVLNAGSMEVVTGDQLHQTNTLVASAQTDITDLTTNVSGLEGRVDVHEQRLDDHDTTLGDHASHLAGHDTTLADYNTRITTNTTNIGTIQDSLTTLGVGDGSLGIKYFRVSSEEPDAAATGTDAVAIGPKAQAEGSNSFAAGVAAQASEDNSLAIGNEALGHGKSAIALGDGATVERLKDEHPIPEDAIAIGTNSHSSASASVAIGAAAIAEGSSSIALGDGATVQRPADGSDPIAAIAIGQNSESNGINSVALGAGARAGGGNSLALGSGATAASGIAIGQNAAALAHNNISIGSGAGVGTHASAAGDQVENVAIGVNAGRSVSGQINTAIGHTAGSGVSGNNNVALGHSAGVGVVGDDNISIGTNANQNVTANRSVGIGVEASAQTSGVALGYTTSAGNSGVALGTQAQAANSGTALGSSARADGDFVALGARSTALQSDISAAASAFSGRFFDGSAVSVGSSEGGETFTRRIVNVEDGAYDTDAVNVRQLQAAVTQLTTVGTTVDYELLAEELGENWSAQIAEGKSKYFSVNDGGVDQGNKDNTGATGLYAIAAGTNAAASAESATAIGNKAQALGVSAVVIGNDIQGLGRNSTTIGSQRSEATGESSIAIGTYVVSRGENSIVIGKNSETDQQGAGGQPASNSIVIGTESKSTAEQGIVLGKNSLVSASRGIAQGSGAQAMAADAMALGTGAGAYAGDAQASGTGAKAYAARSIAMGAGATSGQANPQVEDQEHNRDSIAIGSQAVAEMNSSIALGSGARADDNFSQAWGHKAQAQAEYAIAQGSEATAMEVNAIAMGRKASSLAEQAIAIGAGAHAGHERSVALGDGAKTAAAVGTSSKVVGGLHYNYAGGSPVGTISVGTADEKRTITNVAAGRVESNSTDAVNGSQLFATNTVLGNVANSIGNGSGSILGGNAKVGTDGRLIMSNIGGTGKHTVHDAIQYAAQGWRLAASGVAGSQPITPGQTATFAAGTNMVVERSGSTITYKTANDVSFDTVEVAEEINIANSTTINQAGITTNRLNTTLLHVGNDALIVKDGSLQVGVGTLVDMGHNRVTNVEAGVNGTDAVNMSQLGEVADIANLGWQISANGDNSEQVEPGALVDFSNTDGNVVIDHSGTNLVFDLASDIAVDSVTTGNTVMNNSGVVVNDGASTESTLNASGLTVTDGAASTTVGASSIVLAGAGSIITLDGSAGTITGLRNQSIAYPEFADGSGRAATEEQLDQVSTTANLGWQISANGGTSEQVAPGALVDFSNTDGNVVIDSSGTNLVFDLASDIAVDSVTTGNTVMDSNGLRIRNDDGDELITLSQQGLIIVGGASITMVGINAGNLRITNVAAGVDDTDAVNVSQLKDVQQNIDDLGDRAVKYDGNVNDPKDSITLEGDNGTTITNLADGRIEAGSTDAVNGGQIHDMGESIADGMGGGSRFEDGKLITELNVGGNSYDNVNDALVGVHGDLSEQITNVEEVANAGWNVTDADGNTSNIGPNGQVAFVGDNNISVQQSGSDNKGKIEIALNDNITVNSITAVNVDAQKITTNEIVINNGGPIINENGIDMSDNRITNVAPGIDGTDAVNVNQLGQATGGLQNQINDLRRQDKRLGAGIAAAMATASLPQAYLPGKTMMSMAAGTWDSESGMAIGFSGISDNGHWVYKLSGNATSRGDYGAAVGIGYQW